MTPRIDPWRTPSDISLQFFKIRPLLRPFEGALRGSYLTNPKLLLLFRHFIYIYLSIYLSRYLDIYLPGEAARPAWHACPPWEPDYLSPGRRRHVPQHYPHQQAPAIRYGGRGGWIYNLAISESIHLFIYQFICLSIRLFNCLNYSSLKHLYWCSLSDMHPCTDHPIFIPNI